MNRLFPFVFFLFVFVSLAAAQMDPAMSLYFSFDVIVGDTIVDSSGHGNDGMPTQNPVTEEGVFGDALKFGAGMRIELDGANFVGIPEDAVTMAVWLNLEGLGTQQEIFDCIGSSHGNGQYHFELQTSGAVRWFHRDETETQIFSIQTGSVPIEKWAHVAGTYDSNASSAALFIDGVEITRVGGNGKLSANWEVSAGIGQHKAERQLLGLMDEFYIFNRALDADEIVALMNGEFQADVAVEPGDGLTTTWGEIKR